MNDKPLVRIVDDDEGLRKAMAFLLEVEGWEVASFDSARAFLTGDTPSRPGCAVIDVRMPQMSGLELQAELSRRHYPHPIIFLTAHGDVEMAVQAMQAGAVDFVLKPIGANGRLQAGISRAIELDARRCGAPFLAPSDAQALAETLTPREREVARLVAQGVTTRDIASAFSVSERTVEAQRHAICKKLRTKEPAAIARILELAAPAR